MSSRRLARRDAVAPIVEISTDPNRVVQQTLKTPRGEVRAWFKGGLCTRVRLPDGRMYSRDEGPAMWAAILGGNWPLK